jgi:hypothetical protein
MKRLEIKKMSSEETNEWLVQIMLISPNDTCRVKGSTTGWKAIELTKKDAERVYDYLKTVLEDEDK